MIVRNTPWIFIGFVFVALIFLYFIDHAVIPSVDTFSKVSEPLALNSDKSNNVMSSFAQLPPFTSHYKDLPRIPAASPLFTDLKGNVTKLKTILYWNEFYGRYDTYDFGYGHEAFVEKGCAYSGCFATKDRSLMSIDQV